MLQAQPPKLQPYVQQPINANPPSEALYEPSIPISNDEKALRKSVERYNLVLKFLQQYPAQYRDFLAHLMINLVPDLKTCSFSEIDRVIAFLKQNQTQTNETQPANTNSFDTIVKSLEQVNTESLVATKIDFKINQP